MSNFLIDEDTDLLAAEFVLGTLDSEERANAQSLLRTDHGFIAMVRIWERRFGELHLMVEPVEPDAKILHRIKAKIAEIAPSEPAPEGKPPAEAMPSPEPPATGLSASPEMPKPVDVATDGETPQPPDVPPNGTMPKPQDVPADAVPAKGEPEKPAETTPALEAAIPAAADVEAGAESRPPEPAAKSERGPAAKVAIPAPPPLPPPPLKLPDRLADKFQDARPVRRPEVTIDVIRSRGRWRAFGVCMVLLAIGLVALLAAWRLVPDLLPAGLRPAELMMSIGIESAPKAAPPVKRAPPESQFDE
jgi:hypothetical protein